MSPEFLTLEDVLAIHEVQIDRFGGSPGLRDQGLLESALCATRDMGDTRVRNFRGEMRYPPPVFVAREDVWSTECDKERGV